MWRCLPAVTKCCYKRRKVRTNHNKVTESLHRIEISANYFLRSKLTVRENNSCLQKQTAEQEATMRWTRGYVTDTSVQRFLTGTTGRWQATGNVKICKFKSNDQCKMNVVTGAMPGVKLLWIIGFWAGCTSAGWYCCNISLGYGCIWVGGAIVHFIASSYDGAFGDSECHVFDSILKFFWNGRFSVGSVGSDYKVEIMIYNTSLSSFFQTFSNF